MGSLCLASGCTKPTRNNGLCWSHYDEFIKNKGIVLKDGTVKVFKGKVCSVDGCEFGARKSGYCHKHYKRMKTNGTIYRNVLNHEYFSDVGSPDVCYVAGILYGDGCLTSYKDKSFYVRVEMMDKDVIDFIHSNMGSSCKIHKLNRGFGTYLLCYTSERMHEDLKYFNVIPNKTHSKNFKFPELSEECSWAYLCGLYDSDGSLCNKGRSVWLIGTCEQYSKEVIEFLSRYGISASLFVRKDKGALPLYIVIISNKKSIIKFYSYIYGNSPFTIKRKLEKVKYYMTTLNWEVDYGKY